MGESTRHREAFDFYWRLGADRSIDRLRRALAAQGKAPTLRTLYEWSRRYHCQRRIAQLEAEARRADNEARIRALRSPRSGRRC